MTEMDTHASGAKHGKVRGRFDLLPWEALEKAAIVMEENLASHGEDTWRLLDRATILNHAIAHLGLHISQKHKMKADTGYIHVDDEDHLAHALCRVLMANAILAEDSPKPAAATGEIVAPASVPPPGPQGEAWPSRILWHSYVGPVNLVAYLSHAYASDPEGNTVKACKYARLLMEFANGQRFTSVIVPHTLFKFMDEATERDAVLASCIQLVSRADVLIVAGDVISKGMQMEMDEAARMNMPRYRMTEPDLLNKM